jgi:hypothetical protein
VEGKTKTTLRTLNVSLCYNITDEGVAQMLRCPKLKVCSPACMIFGLDITSFYALRTCRCANARTSAIVRWLS